MSIPFIYKYKPSTFYDFEIQPEIITILLTLISMNNLNILFVGNTGSGKTSLINTLIKEYYGKDYTRDNILEINCLKEQGIQYYRTEVKTFCQSRCSIPTKKKIVILDDIDNINEQSQQVFRNCIDKYNNNVHFISSCCNIQKVIDSLQSRQLIIKLKSLSTEQIGRIFTKIKLVEQLTIDKNAEDFIISVCNGSIRILLNYLEKFKIINKPIDLNIANQVCTNISFTIFSNYTNHILNNNLTYSIDILYGLFDKGYSVMDIYDNYLIFIKSTTLIKENYKYEIIKLLCKYITIFHNIHEDEIELALFSNDLIQIFYMQNINESSI
jgi:DNA polymerase III delta prime subunit